MLVILRIKYRVQITSRTSHKHRNEHCRPNITEVALEKLTVTQLVKKFPGFMGTEGSLPGSQLPSLP